MSENEHFCSFETKSVMSECHDCDVPCPLSPSHGFLHHAIGPFNNATRSLTITVLEPYTVFEILFDLDYAG
jgi:hypothetical protein